MESQRPPLIIYFVFLFVHNDHQKFCEAVNSDKENENTNLPDELEPFNFQLAGHVFEKKGKKLGVLKDRAGNLWKPHPTDAEVHFYNFLESTQDPILLELKQFIPTYLGTRNIKIHEEDVRFLLVKNIMKDFELPCSMDVKIGLIRRPSWAPLETDEQKRRYLSMMKKWGFGIPGFQYYAVKDRSLIQEGKEFGYRMQPREGLQSLYNFMNGELGFKCGLVDNILDQLRKIAHWFQRQRHFRFYDSSVLLTYDAKNLAASFENKQAKDDENHPNDTSECRYIYARTNIDVQPNVRMLDFGKVVPDTEDKIDDNYFFGLKNLILILENLSNLEPGIREVIFNENH